MLVVSLHFSYWVSPALCVTLTRVSADFRASLPDLNPRRIAPLRGGVRAAAANRRRAGGRVKGAAAGCGSPATAEEPAASLAPLPPERAMAPRCRRSWLGVLLGLALGFALASRLVVVVGPRGRAACGGRAAGPEAPASRFMYVGVMSAQKYLRSRALAAYRTWARHVPGRVEFFSSEGSDLSLPLPLVALAGVDDTYPPQKKSFLMLKHMGERHLQRYEWFVRADDDTYIRGERLERFLRGLNSSRPLYLGQTGLGAAGELGELALEPGDNFCMGGPGVVLSRELLRRLLPHIGQCLREMHTTHEDLELGRCVRRFAGAQCAWSYEMQQLFYENYEQNKKGYIQDLHNSKIQRAITLHPNKSPEYQYRLHSYMLSHQISELRYRTIQLHREIALMSKYSNSEVPKDDAQLGIPPSFMRFQPQNREEVLEWEFLTGKYLYSAFGGERPRKGMDLSLKQALDDILMQLMEMINANAKSRGRIIDFQEIQYGYRRVNPMYGAEYVLDLLLLYKKYKGKKMTLPVRRHVYLQQSFSKVQFSESEEIDAADLAHQINWDSQSLSILSNPLQIFVPFQLGPSDLGQNKPKDQKINILIPLSGRFEMFARLMENFERTCLLSNQNVKLVILLLNSDSNPDKAKQLELTRDYQEKYPQAEIQVLPVAGKFSRAAALHLGAAQFSNDSLLLFCDVDLIFSIDFLQRCRSNAAPGKQVYFPVIFTQYDPKIVHAGKSPNSNNSAFTQKTGFWRHYGFGITCIYKSDLLLAGGFNISIRGWGMEDVDLYNKVIQVGLKPFRSQEVGIIHIHHPIYCDPNLEPNQFKMCVNSRASTYGSTQQLAELWLEKQSSHSNVSTLNSSKRTT
ncbi:chondroitin sulfate synthase 1 [Narcine bancroftii]|uniref:chondroitin sulfate synthase 1 n=1 Tax=Narcine bancroftii TaxID=1343680 RepID=UPI0038317A61